MRKKGRRRKIRRLFFAVICLWLVWGAQGVTAAETGEGLEITDGLLDKLDMKEIEDMLLQVSV